MGSMTLLNTLTNLKSINGVISSPVQQAAFSDYKAMVCILFSGGMDSFNMLIPSGTTASDNGFNDYKAVRTDLAIQTASTLRPLTISSLPSVRGIASAYNSFGLHPQMQAVQGLFNSGRLAFMANIGTLVEPLNTYTDYQNNLKKKPLGLYSHSDQQMQWQTSVPQSRDALGVGGRIADLLNASNTYDSISMNISLAGKNSFQRGKYLSEYSINNNVSSSSVGFESVPSWWGSAGLINQLRDTAIDSLVSKSYANLLQKTYAQTTKSSMDTFEVFRSAMQRVKTFTTAKPANNRLADDLLAVARIMSVQQFLGVKRQIFFIDYGGWDMHSDLVDGLNARLPIVSNALKYFDDLVNELKVSNPANQPKVTTFTISDFARTITSNGQGSDHAWGGNMMVMGDAVVGGKIYGGFPQMNVLSYNRNVSFRGNFIPAVSTDEFYAELALWYGVSPNDLCYVLPNLGNFYSYSPTTKPVGFMNFAGETISTDDRPEGCLTY
jgi:uncharacterized protein (DUF1501 family)